MKEVRSAMLCFCTVTPTFERTEERNLLAKVRVVNLEFQIHFHRRALCEDTLRGTLIRYRFEARENEYCVLYVYSVSDVLK